MREEYRGKGVQGKGCAGVPGGRVVGAAGPAGGNVVRSVQGQSLWWYRSTAASLSNDCQVRVARFRVAVFVQDQRNKSLK